MLVLAFGFRFLSSVKVWSRGKGEYNQPLVPALKPGLSLTVYIIRGLPLQDFFGFSVFPAETRLLAKLMGVLPLVQWLKLISQNHHPVASTIINGTIIHFAVITQRMFLLLEIRSKDFKRKLRY